MEKGLLLELRFRFDQYINLRPVKLFPGVETPLAGKGPDDIDFVVVRENTEDLYCGVGGFLKKGTPDEVAMQTAVYTRKGCERCIRWAFDYTRKRNKKKTAYPGGQDERAHLRPRPVVADLPGRRPRISGHQGRLQPRRRLLHVDGEEPRVFRRDRDDEHVRRHHHRPGRASLQGGMGVAAGGNINPQPGGTSMFEPMGGSAPKYTGKNVINPIAAISATAMLLEHSGYPQAAARVMKAIQIVTGTKMKSQAAGRMGYGTREVGDLVCEAL